jgi:hypothetical protein
VRPFQRQHQKPQPDLKAMARNLFAGTCEMLKLDPNNLTNAQKVRVDRASALRLQIDDLQAAQLRGAQIDMAKLIEASEALEHLLATSEVSAIERRPDDARQQLFKLISNLQTAEKSEAAWLRDENKELRAEIERLRCEIVAQRATPAPQPLPDNVVPIDVASRANTNKPPPHYLQQQADDSVALCAPWSPPGGLDAVSRGAGWK